MLIVIRITADLSGSAAGLFFVFFPSIASLLESTESKKRVVSVRMQRFTCRVHKDTHSEREDGNAV